MADRLLQFLTSFTLSAERKDGQLHSLKDKDGKPIEQFPDEIEIDSATYELQDIVEDPDGTIHADYA